MRTILIAAALGLVTLASPHAQTVTCNASDVACRVQHNDSAALGAKLDKLDTDLQALTKQLQSQTTSSGSTLTTSPTTGSTGTTTTGSTTPSGGGTATASLPAGTVTATDPCGALNGGKWTTLQISNSVSIAAAMNCAGPGFKLLLEPGVYKQVFNVPDGLSPWDIGGDVANGGNADTVKLDGQGGCTVDQNNAGGCATKLSYGKGVIHAATAGIIHDLEVRNGGSNASGNHDGQAGIYLDGGNGATGTFTVEHVMVRNNENGIFSNNNVGAMDIKFIEDDFVANGTDGGSHSSYMGGGSSLTLQNIHDYGSNQGNNQKSRIPVVTATDGFNLSNQGRWIELADGGTLTVTGGTYVGSTCCQNVFGNGDESTSKGPGNTNWSNSIMWLGRQSNFANAGSFTGSGITMSCAAGAYANNGQPNGGALTGLPSCPTSAASPPATPAFISGAKS